MESEYEHQPVLLNEVLDALNIREDGCYVDATFGRGGHTQAILERLGEKGSVIAMDQDPQAIAYGQQFYAQEPRIEFEHCNFSQVKSVISARAKENDIDGILMDLGVSSPQLDDAERGFSFLRDGPLDMRMNSSEGENAMQWLARVELYDLTTVLKRFGEERFARRIATAIIEKREENEIATTAELAGIISDAIPVKEKHKHPATRSFQAIRMFINDELQTIERGLEGSASVLAVGGRLAVISFHSLEDRLVKRFMRKLSKGPELPAGLPVMTADIEQPYRLVGKPTVSGEEELKINPRARSARLRVLERVH